MLIEYHPKLVESAVAAATRQDAALERRLHAVTDPLYALPPGPQREARFQQAYATFFSSLGLERVLTDLLDEQPLIGRLVDRCVVLAAGRTKDESAELFVKRGEQGGPAQTRSLLIRVCPQSLLDGRRLRPLMGRELLHVADMLDGQFGYRLESIGGPPSRQNLIRDRYRAVWDSYVEGRLLRAGKVCDSREQELWQAFLRAFGRHGEPPPRQAFDRVFSADELTHVQIFAWAADPDSLCGPGTGQAGRLGELCPLCGFPTFDWYEFSAEGGAAVAGVIAGRRPEWRPDRGACRQCAETYAAARGCSRADLYEVAGGS